MDICPNCKVNKRAKSFLTTNSKNPNSKKKQYLLKWCWGCLKKPYLKYRKDYCESCGFIPVNMCQLDVDHIDGNHENNNEDNLQTLCSNCHRLKTFNQMQLEA